MNGTSSPEDVSTKLQRIAELARQRPKLVLTTLAHHIDLELLREAHRLTRKDGAAGVDGQTAADYAANLEGNLRSLLDRFKSGTYHAPPVRRVHIPKGSGSETRPIGIPTFEDKILQRAVVLVLEAVYEQDFLACSYGFRPGRSAHQALEALWKGAMDCRGGWVLELDIKAFFDSVDRVHLRSFLDQRVRDGVLRRTIDKWLKAGVLEAGSITHPDAGTPQGGVISPLLANIYLHEVLDAWFEAEVRPRLHGRSVLVRYADDAVIVFEREDDAQRVLAVLPKRFGRYGLTLHPDKTRLVDFRRPRRWDGDGGAGGGRGSFDLLGFTHYWDRSRKGNWVVRKKTSSSSFSRALRRISEWCQTHRHTPIADQHDALTRKLKGHYAYFGLTGNGRALGRFLHEVERVWRRWLHRRSGRAKMVWDRFKRLLQRLPLPPARVVHSVYRQAAKP
jgi:group II intron reverse transcriptase/maturase